MRHLLHFSRAFRYHSILASNQYADPYGKYETLAALGAYRIVEAEKDAFAQLKDFYEQQPSWLFGHLSYGLKNEFVETENCHQANFQFPKLAFFEPAYLIVQKRGSTKVELWCNEEVDSRPLQAFKTAIESGKEVKMQAQKLPKMQAKMSKADYLKEFNHLSREIQLGNIYEVNYCQEFFAENVQLDAESLYYQLNQKSPMPFSSFYRFKDEVVIGASPERFLAKRGNQLFSQPIKGTARKGRDEKEDNEIKAALRNDLKEQTENVMIVDLVRNDLSRTAEKASVKVEELFGLYSFPQVHQLISTISSRLSEQFHFTDALKYAFPMGSMTGAPKISAMKLIDKHEWSQRQMYSAAIGYIDPNGDFDFNVVIRSLIYAIKQNYLSLSVGGAITQLATAENEYEECLLKAKAIFEL